MLALLSPISFYLWVTWCLFSLQAIQVKKKKKVSLQASHSISESNQIINSTKNVCFNLLTLRASMATNNFSREVFFFQSLHLRSTGEQIAGKCDKILTFYEAQSNTTEARIGNICRLLSPNYVYSRLEKKLFSSIGCTSMCQMKHLKKFKGLLSCNGQSPFPTSHSGSVPKNHVTHQSLTFYFPACFKNNNIHLDLCLKHTFKKCK